MLYDCDIYENCRTVSGLKDSKRDDSDTEDIDIEYRNRNNSDESHEINECNSILETNIFMWTGD